MAQPAATSSDDTMLSEVVVTARRKAESLQAVPQTVNAVTGGTLTKLNIQRFEDVQAIVPGLNLSSGNTGYTTAATVRGASFQVESGAPPTVAFYLNEATIQSSYLFQSMFDVGQIEVLRGPQGTLRGVSSPSGAITVTTQRPNLSDFGGVGNLSVNDQHGRNLNGAVNLPVIKEVLAFRLAGIIDDNRYDQVRSLNNPLHPSQQSWGVRPSVRFEPNDNLAVNLMYQHFDRKLTSFNPVESLSLNDPSAPVVNPIIHAQDRLGLTDEPLSNHTKQDIVTGNVDYRFAGQKLSYVGSWSKQDILAFTPGDTANAFPDREYGQTLHSRAKQATNEIRLASEDRLFGQFDYTVGAYLSHFNPPSDLTNQSAITLFGRLVSVVDTPIQRRSKARERSIFGNATWHIGEATELSGGLRHIWYDDSGLLKVNGATLSNLHSKDEATIYNVSLSHKFSQDFLVYANTGSAFRPGPSIIGIFRPPTPLITKYTELENEKSKSYELGFKSTFLDKRVLLNVAAYHQDFKNFIYRGPSVAYIDLNQLGPRVNTANFGSSVDAKIDGVDIDAAFQVAQGFNITAAFSYAKSKIKNQFVACNDLNRDGVPDINAGTPTLAQLQASTGGEALAQCQVSDPISFTPKWSLVLQSEYAKPISDSVDGYVRGLLSYYPKNRQDPYNTYDNVTDYGLLNLYGGVRSKDGAWDVSLYAKNITKTQKTLNRANGVVTTQFQALQPPTFTSVVSGNSASSYLGDVRLTPVREFGVNVRYAFGSR
ncbi:TonB-dependent receptor plug domain-containing protein [Phenylobacterium sp. LjRoot225]|uniref:TonB-dependent receptor n=1 Tax=Phenylobacterium sp. LjRoot225 TaxID=3342285 RepID=UPI003ECD9A63